MILDPDWIVQGLYDSPVRCGTIARSRAGVTKWADVGDLKSPGEIPRRFESFPQHQF